MATYVRFETPYRCESTGQRLGVFRAMPCVDAREDLDEWTRDLLQCVLGWFDAHLPVPPSSELDCRAIFWFHRQSDVVREMWYFAAILREEGVQVALRRTDLPGRIVYRDDFQIAAIPYGHGRRPRKPRTATWI